MYIPKDALNTVIEQAERGGFVYVPLITKLDLSLLSLEFLRRLFTLGVIRVTLAVACPC
jgi:hypothetical protein